MDYISQNHSKHLILAHLIFSCKYRKELLTQYGGEIKQLFLDIAEEYQWGILQMEVDKNHLHVLVQYPPKWSVLEMVKLFKQLSTYRIWRQNNNEFHLKTQFWKEKTFWADGYFVCSVGNATVDTIREYIKNQG